MLGWWIATNIYAVHWQDDNSFLSNRNMILENNPIWTLLRPLRGFFSYKMFVIRIRKIVERDIGKRRDPLARRMERKKTGGSKHHNCSLSYISEVFATTVLSGVLFSNSVIQLNLSPFYHAALLANTSCVQYYTYVYLPLRQNNNWHFTFYLLEKYLG